MAIINDVFAPFICNFQAPSSGGSGGAGGFIPPAEFIKVPKERFSEGAPDVIQFKGTTYYFLTEDDFIFYYSKNSSTSRSIMGLGGVAVQRTSTVRSIKSNSSNRISNDNLPSNQRPGSIWNL